MSVAMVRNIDIGLLRSFIAVVETGTVTEAAGTLSLTQAAVSQQIKRLEELIGKPMFVRAQRKLALSPDGERLLPYAQRLVALNDETWRAMAAPAFDGEVRSACPMTSLLASCRRSSAASTSTSPTCASR